MNTILAQLKKLTAQFSKNTEQHNISASLGWNISNSQGFSLTREYIEIVDGLSVVEWG